MLVRRVSIAALPPGPRGSSAIELGGGKPCGSWAADHSCARSSGDPECSAALLAECTDMDLVRDLADVAGGESADDATT